MVRMPKLWNETIEEHREAVRTATLEATAALVKNGGLAAVTMTKIAKETGIGRSTLYKYYPDVEAILLDWHEREIEDHLQQLTEIRNQPGELDDKIRRVFETYAVNSGRGHHGQLGALLHRGHHAQKAQHQLVRLIADLLAEGARAGSVRNDVAVFELAQYCVNALAAAQALETRAAIQRLVGVIWDGLLPRSD
jgi:AcrR family transcriptional regulator